MKLAKILCPLVFALAAGCGGGGDDGTGDDAPAVDAAPSNVVSVDCASATIAETITTYLGAYSPSSVTISVGEVVRFAPESIHDVNGDGFDVPLGGEGCFRFDAAGTYEFLCNPHQFTGTVVVQ